MVGRFPAGRPPFLQLAPDDIHRRVVALDEHRFNSRRVPDLRAKLQRGLDGALRMVFRRPEFDAGVQNHEIIVAIFPPVADPRIEWAADQCLEALFPLEDRRRPGHPLARQQRREHPVARRIGEGAAFPLRQFPDSRLPQSGARHARDADRVSRPFHVEPHQPRRRQRGRECPVGHMVPSSSPQAGRVAQAALDLVGQCDGDNQVLSARILGLGHRERGGNVVAGVGRFPGQIGVVEIQVTNQAAVGKSRPIRRRPLGRAQQGRAALGGESRSDAARDHARLGLPRPQRATDRVNHASLDLVDDRRGEFLELQSDGIFCQLFGERFHVG